MDPIRHRVGEQAGSLFEALQNVEHIDYIIHVFLFELRLSNRYSTPNRLLPLEFDNKENSEFEPILEMSYK
jgi:hypothetical protein